MATYTSSSGRYTTTLTITQGTQDIATNSSVVNWSLTLVSDGGTLWHYDDTCPWNVKINGTTVNSGTFSYDLRSGGTQTVLSRSGTTTITHDSDGTKTISVSGYTNMDNPSYVSPMTASGNFTLTTIPRASDVSVTSSYTIANTTGSLSATISPKASFYHRWKWTVGSYTSGWTNLTQSSSSQTISVTNTNLLGKLPTSASGTITFTVETHNGSAYSSSTLVGSSTATSALAITLTAIKPTLSYSTIAVDNTPISGYAIRGYSTLKVTSVSSTGGSGTNALTVTATISGISGATMATKTLSSASGSNTISNGTMTSNTLPAGTSNVSSGTVKFSLTATDSRGASTTVEKTYSATVYGYTPPVVTLNAYRVNSSSSTTPDGAGAWVYVASCTAVKGSSINNTNSIVTGNSATRAVVTLGSTTTTYTTLSSVHQKWFSLAITSSGSIVLYAKDTVGGTAQAQVSIGNATYPIILRDNGSGTVGVGIGTFPNASEVDSALNVKIINKGRGYYLVDSAGNSYPAVYDNQSNLWIGATQTASTHHRGGTYISAGYNGSAGNTTINVCVPNASNNGGTNYAVYHDNYHPLADSATRATNATYEDWTETNPTSITTYYVPFGAGYSTNTSNRGLLSNNGFSYRTQQGTASALGFSILNLGNSTGSGTAGNKQGAIRLYANDTTYTELRSQAGGNGYIAYLPKLSSAHAYLQSASSLWTGTLTGGNTATITASGYSRIKVFALTWGVQHVFEIDLSDAGKALSGHGLTDSSYPFQGGSVVVHRDGAGTSGGSIMYYSVSCKVSSDKKTIWVTSIGYSSLGTSFNAFTTRLNNSEYYVYKVEGMY